MSSKTISREKIMGMAVYNPDGVYVGTVKDFGFTLGEEKEIRLIVQAKTGGEVEVDPDNISAIGDIIILKEKVEIPEAPEVTAPTAPEAPTTAPTAAPTAAPAAATAPKCPTCGRPLRWIEEVSGRKVRRWWCDNCRKYI